MSSVIIYLPSVCDSDAASRVRQECLEHISIGHGLNIDASAVERVSTAMLQVLLAASRACLSQAIGFSFSSLSTSLEQAFTDLDIGLDSDHWGRRHDPLHKGL